MAGKKNIVSRYITQIRCCSNPERCVVDAVWQELFKIIPSISSCEEVGFPEAVSHGENPGAKEITSFLRSSQQMVINRIFTQVD